MSVLVNGSDCRGRDRRHKVRVGASGPHVAPNKTSEGLATNPRLPRGRLSSHRTTAAPVQPTGDVIPARNRQGCRGKATPVDVSGGCLRAGRSAVGGGR